MDGLEAIELKLSEVLDDNESFRFDSEYFRKEMLTAYKNLKEKPFYFNRDISLIKSGTTPKERDEELKEGVVLLKTNDIRNNILLDEKENFFYIDDSTDEKMKSSRLKKGDVLINIVGATTDVIGRTSLILENFPKANITQAMAFCRIKQNILKQEYLFVFLQTYYGKIQVKRLARPTGQYNLNLEEIAKILIPRLDINFQTNIETLVNSSYQKLQDSKALYKEAEELLLKELDLLDFKLSNENFAIKSFKESFGISGRLDSEYYQPKYDQIEKLISEQGSCTYIKNEFNHIKTSFDKSKDGYNYTEIGNVNVSDGTNISNYVEIQDLPANAKINVKNGDLLVSTVRPYRGAVTIINTEEDDLIVSGAFTVLRRKENSNINTQVLQVLLRTNIYKELLLKYNVGTQYPVIKDEDVLNLIIPNIDETIQTLIEEKIKKSFELKEESKKLLDLAKKTVEVAIEKNEKDAIKIINEASI